MSLNKYKVGGSKPILVGNDFDSFGRPNAVSNTSITGTSFVDLINVTSSSGLLNSLECNDATVVEIYVDGVLAFNKSASSDLSTVRDTLGLGIFKAIPPIEYTSSLRVRVRKGSAGYSANGSVTLSRVKYTGV